MTRFAVSGRRLAGDVGVQIVGRVLNLALGVVAVAVLSRTLGPAGFGQWTTVLAIVQILGYFGELGVQSAAVRFAASDDATAPAWLGTMLATRAVLSVPAAIVAVLVCAWSAQDTSMAVAGAILSLTLVVGALGGATTVFQLRFRNDISMVGLTVNTLLWTAAVVALSSTGTGTLVTFAVGLVVAQAIMVGGQAAYALRLLPLRIERARVRELLRVGVPVGVGGLLTFAYGKVDQIMVFELLGERPAGLYGAAYGLLDRVQFVPMAVMTTLFPALAAAGHVDPDRVKRLVQAAADHLAMVSLPAVGLTLVAGEQIMTFFFGPEFVEGARVLPWLMIAFVSISFGYLAGQLAVIHDLQVRFVVIAAGALVLNVAGNFLLLPEFGFVAAAWTTVATEILVFTLAARMTLRAMHYRPRVGRLVRTALAAGVMTGALFAVEAAGAGLVVLLAVAGTVYVAAALTLRVVSPAELRALRGGAG